MSINEFREMMYIYLTMDKVVSYHEFLKHKSNLEQYLKNLFDNIPELNVYFPINLSSEERHLIYTQSKGYLFEKLHKIGSKYSIKLWKPVDPTTNVSEEECVTDEEYVSEDEEEYELKSHLTELSNVLDSHHTMMLNEIRKCRRSVNRIECIFVCVTAFNFVSSILFLTHMVDVISPLPRLSTVTDF
jgi:hypothetical protein